MIDDKGSTSIKEYVELIDINISCGSSKKASAKIKIKIFDKIKILKRDKFKLLNQVITYFELHLQQFKPPKSLEILNEIFTVP